jgi:LacI family transcriptional regulator
MISIRQLAKLCNVSPMTVSKALRDVPGVNLKTKEHIKSIAAKFHYRPNQLIKGVFKARSNLIGIIIHDVAGAGLPRRLSSTIDLLKEHGFGALVMNGQNDPEQESHAFLQAIERRVSGMIISTWNYEGTECSYSKLRQHEIPFVVVGEQSPLVDAPRVHGDNYEAGRIATQHLIELKHKKIAYLAGPTDLSEVNGRLSGYREALIDAGISYRKDYVISCQWSQESACEAINHFLNEHPVSAVVAINDRLARGAMEAIKKKKLSIPKDISVIGIGDSDFNELLDPSLTTVAQDFIEIARKSVDLLFDLIDQIEKGESPSSSKKIIVPVKLITRKSTASYGG